MGKYLLAIDCGLTNCKMVLFDTNGERIGLQSFRTPLQDLQEEQEDPVEAVAVVEAEQIRLKTVTQGLL